MPLPARLEIVKASAGSGKTFLLSLRYLSLLLANPTAYRHILAVTFTNKATAEMKERILEVLLGLAQGNETVRAYREKLLAMHPGLTEDELSQRARGLYSAILHDYSRFSVSTIDSFVQRVVRSFAWELGISGQFELKMEMDPVKEELADRLYRLLDEDADLRQWMVDIAQNLLLEGRSWKVRPSLLEFSNELFRESFSDFENYLNGLEHEEDITQVFQRLRAKVYATIAFVERRYREVGEDAVTLVNSHGLSVTDFNQGQHGFVNYLFKAADGDNSSPGKNVLKALQDGFKPASGSVKGQKLDQVHSIAPRLIAAVRELLALRQQYETAKALRQNISLLRLMRILVRELGNYRSENDVLLISDTHAMLRELMRDTPAEFIYEKTGSQYRHFLLDEFQDTSGFQWDNFRPLLVNGLSEGHYSLIVGDVKQAIYRWRNGDWRLLLNRVEQQIGKELVELDSLRDNRRSSRQVIEFNNFLFYAAPRLLQAQNNQELDELPLAARETLVREGLGQIFERAYEDAVQELPEDVKDDGYVRFQIIEKTDDEDGKLNYNEEVVARVHQTIAGLLAEGFAPGDIGILTRGNQQARIMVEGLLLAQQQAGPVSYPVISGDALLLDNHPAVRLLIAAIRTLQDPGDSISAAECRHLYRQRQPERTSDHDLFAVRPSAALPEWLQPREELMAQPLPELVHRLISATCLHEDYAAAPYLLAFQDLVTAWSRMGDRGLRAFLTYWDEEGRNKALPSAAGTKAVEVLTIHKSKGLAYPVVLLPFASMEMSSGKGNKMPILWVETAGTDYEELPIVPVNYSSSLDQTDFAAAGFRERTMARMDHLNLLYVACTRARKRIYGWLEAPPNDIKKLSDTGKLIIKAACAKEIPAPPGWPDPRPEGEWKSGDWYYGNPVPPEEPSKPEANGPDLPLTYTGWHEKIRVRARGGLQSEAAQEQLPRLRGAMLHETLSRLMHPDELQRVWKQLAAGAGMQAAAREDDLALLQRMLDMPLFDGWRNGGADRMAERSFLATDGQLRRPDLVLMDDATTRVIDFKFTGDKARETDYIRQVQEYCAGLQGMGFPGVEGWIIYGYGNEPESVSVS